MIGTAARALAVAWDARRTESRGPSALGARQRARLRASIAHARTWSNAYARLYADVPPGTADPTALPPVTKRELMARFDEWVTDPLVTRAGVDRFISDLSRVGEPYLGRYLIGTTSGTTGEPAIIVTDADSIAALLGLGLVRRRYAIPRDALRRSGAGVRSALIVATGGHFMAAAAAESARRRMGLLSSRYQVFSVLEPLDDLVRKLNDFRPLVMAGYATALGLLADEARAGRLRVRPAAIWSSGETLSPAARASIREVFGVPVREVYGGSELLHAAFECPAGRMHVNEDWALLEPVDAEYRPVPPGVPSHTVLVTNLMNRVQPVIRYDLGDSITVLPGRCPCGSPLQTIRPEGRDDDVLVVAGQSGAQAVRLLPLAITSVVEETPGVGRVQLVLEAPDSLAVRFSAAPGASRDAVWPAIDARLRAWLAEQGVTALRLRAADVEPTRDPRTGKFRAVIVERRVAAT